MGVTHKLREDVVGFIIAQKKDIPSIGVRQLAALTSAKFQIIVSKSSVNSVLKKSALSSSIGRRAGSVIRPEKFSIPSIKKKEIFKRINEAGFISDQPFLTKEKKNALPAEEKKETTKLKAKETRDVPALKGLTEKGSTDARREAKKQPASGVLQETEPNQEISQSRHLGKGQGVRVSSGLGFIFLKAAQWDISNRSLVGELFAKHIQLSVSGHFDAVSDMFLYLDFLGAGTPDHILSYREHGLWALNDFCNPPVNENKDLLEFQELFQWNKAMAKSSPLSSLIMEYKRAKEQAFLEVKGFRLLLEDRSELTMNATMASFSGGGAIPFSLHGSLPMDKAMAKLSNCLVSNIQSAVFRAVPGEAAFDRAFYNLIKIFENVPGKRILKVFVLDADDQKIAEFSTVPFQKRTLMVGVEPQMKEFAELTKTAKWAGKRPFYHQGIGRTIHFSDTKTDFMASQIHEKTGEFRIVTIWKDNEQEPCLAILTNQRKDSGEKVLETYVSHWPYLNECVHEGPVPMLPYEEERKKEKLVLNSVSDICSDFIAALHEYCLRHFFLKSYSKNDINQLITNIYSISGVYYKAKDTITVSLDMDAGSVYRMDLDHAAKMVNEQRIFDPLGRRVWIEV